MITLRSPFGEEFAVADAVNLAGVLKALAEPTRLRILGMFHQYGALAVVDVVQALGSLSQPAVSHHLMILEEVGLLDCDRRGVFKVRELAGDVLEDIARLLIPKKAS